MRVPLGGKLLAIFFGFGATMCTLTIVLLLFPGSALDVVWRVNPGARAGFQAIGQWSIVLMAIVGMSCALAAIGLARGKRWGAFLAIVILCVNLLGDSANALLRQDARTLIGLPIAGAMIFYLWKLRARSTR
ncbi:MAG: hypothetical protein ACR2HH_09995 [Chthoniobacterales bacterium]